MILEMIKGRNPVLEALRAGREIKEIFVFQEGRGPAVEEIKRMAGERGIIIHKVDRRRLEQIAGDNNQGVAARIRPRSPWKMEDILQKKSQGILIALDQIQDPQNLGAIIRSAAFTGIDGILIPRDRSAPLTEAARKASSGGLEWVPVVEITNLARTIEQFQERGFWVTGGDHKAPSLPWEVDFSYPTLVVIGSEGRGLRPLIRKKCDHLIRIPGRGQMESLNASVATGIILYEIMRQRKWEKE